MDIAPLIESLKDGGPWAIVALALSWLARAYVKVRDEHDAYKDGLLTQMKDILTESTTASVQQASSNQRLNDSLERLERSIQSVRP